MEDEIRKETVDYWHCPQGHRHKTAEAAQACADKMIKAKERRRTNWDREYLRRDKAKFLHERGLTYQEIGWVLGQKDDPSKPLKAQGASQLVRFQSFRRTIDVA